MNDIAVNVSRLNNKAAYDRIALRPKRRPARNARGARQQHVIRAETHVNGYPEEESVEDKETEVEDESTKDVSPPEPKRSRPPSHTLELPKDEENDRPSSGDSDSAVKRFSMLGRSPVGPGPGMIVPSLEDVQKIKLRKRQPGGTEMETENTAKVTESKPKSTSDKAEKPKQKKKSNESKPKLSKQEQKENPGGTSAFSWKKSSSPKPVGAELSPEGSKENEKPKSFFAGIKAGKKNSQDKESKGSTDSKSLPSSEKKDAPRKKGILARKREKNHSENNSNTFRVEVKDDVKGLSDSPRVVAKPKPESPDLQKESIFPEKEGEKSLLDQINAAMSERHQEAEEKRESKYSAMLRRDVENLAEDRLGDEAPKSPTAPSHTSKMLDTSVIGEKHGKTKQIKPAAKGKTVDTGPSSTRGEPYAQTLSSPTSPAVKEKPFPLISVKKNKAEQEKSSPCSTSGEPSVQTPSSPTSPPVKEKPFPLISETKDKAEQEKTGTSSTRGEASAQTLSKPTSPPVKEKPFLSISEEKNKAEQEKSTMSEEVNAKSKTEVKDYPPKSSNNKPAPRTSNPTSPIVKETQKPFSFTKFESSRNEEVSLRTKRREEAAAIFSSSPASSPKLRPRVPGQKTVVSVEKEQKSQAPPHSPAGGDEHRRAIVSEKKLTPSESPDGDIPASSVKPEQIPPHAPTELEALKKESQTDETKAASAKPQEKHDDDVQPTEVKEKLPRQPGKASLTKREPKLTVFQKGTSLEDDAFPKRENKESKVAAPRMRSVSARTADEYASEELYSRSKLKHVSGNTNSKRSASMKISPGSSSIVQTVQRPKSFIIKSARTNSEVFTQEHETSKTIPDESTVSSPSPKTSPTKEKPKLPEKPKSPVKSPYRPPNIDTLMQDAENNNVKPSGLVLHSPKEAAKEIPEQIKSGSEQIPPKSSRARSEDGTNSGAPSWVQMARRRSKVWEDGDLKRQNNTPQRTPSQGEMAETTPRWKTKVKSHGSETTAKLDKRATPKADQPEEAISWKTTHSVDEREKKENRYKLSSNTDRSRLKPTEVRADESDNRPQTLPVLGKLRPGYAGTASRSDVALANNASPAHSHRVQSNRTASIPNISMATQRKSTPTPTKEVISPGQPSWLAIAMQKQKSWSKEEKV